MKAKQALVLLETLSPGIVKLTLNRPDKRNALSLELIKTFLRYLKKLEANSKVRVLLIASAGPIFCAGMDLKETMEIKKSHQASLWIKNLFKSVYSSRLITIAMVQGAALGGGAGFAAACDFIVAEKNASFGFPEVRRGLMPALIMTLLRRQLLERVAKEWLLTERHFNAKEALQKGFINTISSKTLLQKDALKIAQSILEGGPEAISETKKLWNALYPSTLEKDFQKGSHIHKKMRHTDEAREGISSFLENRAPKWGQE